MIFKFKWFLSSLLMMFFVKKSVSHPILVFPSFYRNEKGFDRKESQNISGSRFEVHGCGGSK